MDPTDPTNPSQLLLPCSICFRTFKPDSLFKHQKVCEKSSKKKRKVFDSAKQRIEGTDIPLVRPVKPSPSLIPHKSKPTQAGPSRWREQHLHLIQSVRAAKGVKVEREPSPSISRVFQSLSQDVERCPYCERNFGIKAYDRHVEFCQEQRSRIPKTPTSVEALERQEARRKYRAPPPLRSVRTTNREKYSPTRNSPHQSFLSPPSPPPSLGGSRTSLDSRNSEARKSVRGFTSESRTKPVTNAANNNKNVLNGLERAAGQHNFLRNNGERRSLRMPNRNLSPSNLGPSPLRNSFRGPSSKYSTVKPIVNSYNKAPTRPSVLHLFPTNTLSPGPGRRIDPEGLEAKSVSHCNTTAPVIATNDQKKKAEKVKGASVAQRLRRKVTFQADGPLSQSMVLTRSDETRANMSSMSNLSQSLVLSRTSATTVRSRSVSLAFPRTFNSRSGPVQSNPEQHALVNSQSFPNLQRVEELEFSHSDVTSSRIMPMLASSTDDLLMALRTSVGKNEGYDPYMSAQKQMEELLNEFGTNDISAAQYRKLSQDTSVPYSVACSREREDDKSVSESKISPSKLARTYVQQLDKAALLYGNGPSRNMNSMQESEDNGKSLNLKDFENDLQDILSSIHSMDPTTSSAPSTNSDYGSLTRTNKETRRQSSVSSLDSSDGKSSYKFCHACGSAYPPKIQARFCCECGAKRLYS